MKQMNLQVTVTQQNINEGTHKALCACPIARGMKESVGSGRDYPMVETAHVQSTEGHFVYADRVDGKLKRSIYKFQLPQEAQDFIMGWDLGQQMAPFSFSAEGTFHGETSWARSTLRSAHDLEAVAA